MADPAAFHDANGTSTTGPPRWVKVSGAIALVLVLIAIVVLATGGGGEHGPGRHSGDGGQSPPSAIPDFGDGGHQPPPGGHAP